MQSGAIRSISFILARYVRGACASTEAASATLLRMFIMKSFLAISGAIVFSKCASDRHFETCAIE
jgi:hypothetical protein